MAIELTPIRFDFLGTSYSFDVQKVSNDKQLALNLQTLFERKKGVQLRVDENGLIVVATWKDWFSFTWNREEECYKLKCAIHKALSSLNKFFSKQRNQDQEVHKLAIQYLFDKNGEKGIGRLGEAFYDPLWVKSHNHLSRILLPEHTIRVKLGKRFIDYTAPDIDIDKDSSCIAIDLGDKAAEKNLWKLLMRKKGQKYQIGSEEGRSQEKICEEIQEVVTDTITRLNGYLARQHTVTRAHQFAIKMMFSQEGPLCRLNKEIFCRGAIAEGSHIEKILAGETFTKKRGELAVALQQLRDAHEDKNCKLAVEAKLMDLAYEELSFMQKLGVDLEANTDGGSGGARYARDRFGRKILVVKPGDERTSWG